MWGHSEDGAAARTPNGTEARNEGYDDGRCTFHSPSVEKTVLGPDNPDAANGERHRERSGPFRWHPDFTEACTDRGFGHGTA
ncbi:hypothetical protein ACFFYR_29600 [Paraburkholderia dipogonis]|uniref:hypothetical protein n=1 Tax=Paraburkholderia dipogonis TaxID=1211383 RepID=UPI0035EBF981